MQFPQLQRASTPTELYVHGAKAFLIVKVNDLLISAFLRFPLKTLQAVDCRQIHSDR